MRKTNIFDYLDISGGREAREIKRDREAEGHSTEWIQLTFPLIK